MNRKWKFPTTDGKGNNTNIYLVWKSIKHRCLNPKTKDYKNYGGRGITICDSWLNFDNFYTWVMTTNYQKGLQIDRKNNDLGYFPENCRFVTNMENQLNRKIRSKSGLRGIVKHRKLNRFIAYYGINRRTIYIGTYDTIEDALENRNKFLKELVH